MCPHNEPIDSYCPKCPNGIAQALNSEHLTRIDATDVSFACRTENCSRCDDSVKKGFYIDVTYPTRTIEFICGSCALELETEARENQEHADAINADNQMMRIEHEQSILLEIQGKDY